MLKIRLQGTTNDIKWFKKILERDKRITVLDISETYVRIFEQSIPRTEALSETTPEGVSIFAYDICSIGAKSYAELAQEVLHHA